MQVATESNSKRPWVGELGKVAWFAAKLCLGLGVLYWLYRQGSFSPAALGSLALDSRFFAASLLACALVTGALLLLAARLLLLLKLRGMVLRWRQGFGLTLIGALFGSVLPGLVGGDAVKAAYLVQANLGRKSDAVAVVLVDRMVGMYGLFLLGTVASFAAWINGLVPARLDFVLAIAPTVTVAASGFVMALMRWNFQSGSLAQRMISRLPRLARNLLSALLEFRKNGRALSEAVGISVLSHGLIVLVFCTMASLLSDPLSISQHFVLDPLAMVLNVVPLTPGGLGIVEGAFAYLFQNLGSPNGAEIGILGRVVQYLVFASGGLIAMLTLDLAQKKVSLSR